MVRACAGGAGPPRAGSGPRLAPRRSFALHRVTAELIAERGVDLGRERLLLARGEAGEEGRADHRSGHALVDRLENRPAPFAGILDVAGDVLQIVALRLECRIQELEQPAAYDRAVAPNTGDLVEVEVELGRVHDVEALGVGLHEAVLDSVVHHLHEVARAGGADVCVAVVGRQRLEGGLEEADGAVFPADHQAVAVGEAPDPTGDSGVDVAEALLGREAAAPLGVPEVRIPAVDDDVSLIEEPEQLLHGLLGRVARRDHEPDGAAPLELAYELFEGARRAPAAPRIGLDDVAVVLQPLRHVAAHAAETDHPELHATSSRLTRTIGLPRSRSEARSPSACALMSLPKPN